jgi:hypothetical protein
VAPGNAALLVPAAPPICGCVDKLYRAEREINEETPAGDYAPSDLTGVGGSGKTRLALEVAVLFGAKRAPIYPHRPTAWWIELVALGDPALVVQAVAAALGVRECASP